MSARKKCGTCGGEYSTHQADGTEYYHACAPVSADGGKTFTEHVDKRDENVAVDAKGKAAGIKAAGLGAADA